GADRHGEALHEINSQASQANMHYSSTAVLPDLTIRVRCNLSLVSSSRYETASTSSCRSLMLSRDKRYGATASRSSSQTTGQPSHRSISRQPTVISEFSPDPR